MTLLPHIHHRARTIAGLSIFSLIWAFFSISPTNGINASDLENLLKNDSRLKIEDGSFQWIWLEKTKKNSPMSWQSAVFLARPKENTLLDVFVADFKTTSTGGLRAFRRLTNITKTANSDENILVASGDRFIAFSGKLKNSYGGVILLDFAGENPELTMSWPKLWKIANLITNFQQTGRSEGIHSKHFIFREPCQSLEMSFTSSNTLQLSTETDNYNIHSDAQASASKLLMQNMVKGRPAFLAWCVDTVRAIPWVGRRKIERLEQLWFILNDWLMRTKYNLIGESSANIIDDYLPSKEITTATGIPGWPPMKISPLLKKKRVLKGEGIWIPVNDEFTTAPTTGPPLFYKTFVRPDFERPFSTVHLTTWDPSILELKVVAGVREPRPSTSNLGKGEIPRDKKNSEIEFLVGAFNGAFQALHGEWGMVVDRKVLLPPRAYGATIGLNYDGTTTMGTWPYPVAEMPKDMRDLRQNVQPLVENSKFNPYERKWWGGVPEGVEERVITTRSGICLTTGGKFVYFWGQHLSPESLGAAMISAKCDYGIHLDMNPGHCGLEYYRVNQVGKLPAINRKLDDAVEAEGIIPRRNDLMFRARKMVKHMGNMRFPRYVERDPRDFFYLLKKTTIFDGPLPSNTNEAWTAIGAVEGYPVPEVRINLDNNTALYKFDLDQVTLSVEKEEPTNALWAAPFTTTANGIHVGLKLEGTEVSPFQSGVPMLEIRKNGSSVLKTSQAAESFTAIQGVWPSLAGTVKSRHEITVDSEGYFYVHSATAESQDSSSVIGNMGIGKSLALIHPKAESPNVHWLVIRHEKKTAWKRIFTDVKPVPPSKWRAIFKERGHLLEHTSKQ